MQRERQNREEKGISVTLTTWLDAVAAAKQTAGLTVAQAAADLPGSSPPSASPPGFTEDAAKQRKYPVSGSCVEENTL